MSGGRKKGERLPTVLPEALADEADRQAKYWTAVGTIGRALRQLTKPEQMRLPKVLLKELTP